VSNSGVRKGGKGGGGGGDAGAAKNNSLNIESFASKSVGLVLALNSRIFEREDRKRDHQMSRVVSYTGISLRS